MTEGAVTIENGFAEVGAGAWLAGRSQPVSSFGEAVRRRRAGLLVRDRSALSLVQTAGRAFFADAARPFLTFLPCAAPICAVSGKVLLAPLSARTGAELVKIVPMSLRHTLCVTTFGMPAEGESQKSKVEGQKSEVESQKSKVESQKAEAGGTETFPRANHFVVLATASRTKRIVVPDGETLSVRPEAVAAWTGNRPTGFVRRLGVWDVLLPRPPRDLVLHFHGPCVVWVEGASSLRSFNLSTCSSRRNPHGV